MSVRVIFDSPEYSGVSSYFYTKNPILDTNFTHIAFVKFTRIDKF